MEATKREKRRRQESKEEASRESFNLPPEIIREILIRLPAKSIGRFRCVSKLFSSLSSDQGFAKSHLDLTTHRKLIISGISLYALDLDGIGDGLEGITDLVAVELNYPLKEVRSKINDILNRINRKEAVGHDDLIKVSEVLSRGIKIVGCSKGLVCMSIGDDVCFLYNPTTGDSKRLPELTDERYQALGFGFDDLTKDFKVVKLVSDNCCVLKASVYSLKADSWRRICDLNYEHFCGFVAGMNVNGAIHWLFTRPESNQGVLLAFDVKTDEFREMPLPGEPEAHNYFQVEELNGRLCVFNNCFEKLDDDVWVMNEYGVTSSWTRIRISLLYKCVRPLCFTLKNDEILLEHGWEIVLYNFKTDTSRTLQNFGGDLLLWFRTRTYKESLISPNSYCVEN